MSDSDAPKVKSLPMQIEPGHGLKTGPRPRQDSKYPERPSL